MSIQGGKYDVVILGGGLAGLTLALQLKNQKDSISILVLEKRKREAPIATHKVGESTVELGSHYLREVIGLREYLEEKHIIKFGFRYFFEKGDNSKIETRFEIGSKKERPVPTHQIDRGIFENDLVSLAKEKDINVLLGASIQDVVFSKVNSVKFILENISYQVDTNWVIDASGRNAFLKRKLILEKPMDHNVNAVWFRVNYNLDIDDLSGDNHWKKMFATNQRRLATNHLMGNGYWVWIIPLSSNYTSVGIVADETIHPFTKMNTLQKSLEWMQKHEPNLATQILADEKSVADFKVMKHFANDIKQYFSGDKWAITGEAGSFMDAFYSPGTDFIALMNTWITDLIIRDLNNEEINHAMLVYDSLQKEMIRNWLPLYKDKYSLFGNTQVMVFKLAWDWATYWSFPTLLFMNDGYTNITVIKKLFSKTTTAGNKFKKLNNRMQKLFEQYGKIDNSEIEKDFLDLFDLKIIQAIHHKLTFSYSTEDLIKVAEENLTILEELAAMIISSMNHLIYDTSRDVFYDPYTAIISFENDASNEFVIRKEFKEDLDLLTYQKTTNVYEK